MNDKNPEKDPYNIVYSSKISEVCDESGNVLPFPKQKYGPIIDFIIQYCKKITNIGNVRLLDVGIGYGAFLKLCEERGIKRVYGMDPYPVSIDIARNITSAELRIGRIEHMPWPFGEDFRVEVITCLDVVEHLQHPGVFFENVKKYLADESIVVIRTPNKEFPYFLRSLPLVGVRDENPTHISVHNSKYWRHLAQKNDFQIIREWKGEHLTHLKFMPYKEKLLNVMRIDHRKVPILNMFEQGYIMVLKLQNK